MTTKTFKCTETSPFTAGTATKKHGLLATMTHTMLVWQERASMRSQLANLDKENLSDMGLTATEISAELRKPFWQQ
ncbi:hypothetical protein A9Q83_03155 [Alphaproteobacteria bacterium 46_93_T64]|nr:hypothetical protein A9Q83_03155 [Alphaproteobacteria bacterium 46_93_T64]